MAQIPANYRAKRLIISFLGALCCLLTSVLFCQAAADNNQTFPGFKAIAENVAFWEKVYSRYSVNEAVIHDSEDLSKIYEIIPLLSDDLPGASRFNSLFQRQVAEKYAAMLKKLADRKPSSRDEIRVDALFSGKNRRQKLLSAADNVRSQRGQKERFLAGVIHSGRYLEEIKRIFRSYQLPEDLAYLPHVESSFNFKAYSKHGAAGIWQFTRATGRQYLNIDYTLDERLDPIIAARAAARYLQNSYSVLKSWPLALTSYNYGLAGMLRAKNEEGDYVSVFRNYNKGHFKFASKNFYPEFLAALSVAKKLERNRKIKLDTAQAGYYYHLPGYLHIKNACKHFGVSAETIVSLNPALLEPVISGKKHIPKGYILRLPAGKQIGNRLASIPNSVYKQEQDPSLFYQVRSGDTSASIARRHGVSLKSLISANDLDKNAKIYIRQKLRIPKTNQKLAKTGPKIASLKARIKEQKMLFSSGPEVPVLSAGQKHSPGKKGRGLLPSKNLALYRVSGIYREDGTTYGYITVQPEESIWLYANWLSTQGSSISALNQLPPMANIDPGQRLRLAFLQLSPDEFVKKRLDYLRETEEDFFATFKIIGKKIYHVMSGDTLWDLCYNKFDIPLWLFKRYNATVSLTGLNEEQQLIIPIVQQI